MENLVNHARRMVEESDMTLDAKMEVLDFLLLEDILALQEYHKLEEQGLLVILPYTIGTPLYKVDYNAEHKIGCVTPTTMTLKNYADNRELFDKGMYFTSQEKADEKLNKLLS